MDIVINYDQDSNQFKVYEPTTDTVIITTNLTLALINLSNFLINQGLSDILNCPDVNYHLDSYTMKVMIESNVSLLKKINSSNIKSGFMISSQKFGTSTSSQPLSSYKKDNNSIKDSNRKYKSSGKFSGKSGFKSANKKFRTF